MKGRGGEDKEDLLATTFSDVMVCVLIPLFTITTTTTPYYPSSLLLLLLLLQPTHLIITQPAMAGIILGLTLQYQGDRAERPFLYPQELEDSFPTDADDIGI